MMSSDVSSCSVMMADIRATCIRQLIVRSCHSGGCLGRYSDWGGGALTTWLSLSHHGVYKMRIICPGASMTKNALVVGASGIIGAATAEVLTEAGWQVSGLARKPGTQPGVTPIAADLLDPASLKAALAGAAPSHVFLASWLRQATEAENIRVNAGMVRNLLDALRPAGTVRHVALVTGLKH